MRTLIVKVGSYEKDGKTHARYKVIGREVESAKGPMIVLDSLALSPTLVMMAGGQDNVFAYFRDEQDRAKASGTAGGSSRQKDPDDENPF